MECPNCNRDETIILISKHHLIPKVKGGKNKKENYFNICEDCHQQLHVLYSENFLRDHLNTKELILNDEQMIKFGKFANKQRKRIIKRQSNKKYN